MKILLLWSLLLLGKLQFIKSARLKVSKQQLWLLIGQVWHQVTTPLYLLLPKTLGITQNLLAKGKRLFQFLSSVLIRLSIRVPLMIMVPSS